MISSTYSIDDDIHSGLDSLSSRHSRYQDSTRRGGQRSRRMSRLLYAEKYGLNSTFDDNDSGNYNDDSDHDEEHDDNQPHSISLKQRSHSYSGVGISLATLGRPRSLFNLLEPPKTTTRPAAFVKPSTATTNFGTPPSTVPNDMLTIQQLYEQYHKKVYMEGFVFKRNTYNTDGSSCQGNWTKLYVELSGPILFLWDGQKLNNGGDAGSETGTGTGTILPYYINISDATATLVNNNNNNNNENSTPVLMMLNTAGRNQYLIRPEPATLSAAQHWITAIRLSCFECSRLYEIYTRYLLLRPNYQPLWHPSSTPPPPSAKQKRRIEGYVQARFAGDTEWKKYWAVAYDQRHEKRFFGKTKKVPCKSQFMFYESKKSKYPSVTLVNILYAYTLYPQSPQLIDQATMFKVEGTTLTTTNFKTGEQSMTYASAGTLLMTATTNEMMKWLVGIFDVFKLYGRPSTLLDDPMDPKALNFGEMMANDGTGFGFTSAIHTHDNDDDHDDNEDDDDDDHGDDAPQLFLEYPDVMHLPLDQNETLLDSKMAFTQVLAEKLKNRSTTQATSKPPLYAAKPRANSAPLLTDISVPSDYTLDQHIKASAFNSPSSSTTSIPCQRPHPAEYPTTMPLGRSRAMVYASDDSSDEADDKSYSDQSDDDSIFINNRTPQLTATQYMKEPHTPSEPNTPSSPGSLHQSTDVNEPIAHNEGYQPNNNVTITSSSSSNDMMGFAKSLLSKTFGMDYSTSPVDNETNIPVMSLVSQSPHTASPENMSPVLQASITTENTNIDKPATLTAPIHKPIVSKRISVMPLASDDEDSDDDDGDNRTDDDEDDDDEPIHNRLVKNMKITTSPSLTKRPISTLLSASTTTTATTTNMPPTPGTNRSSAEINSQYPYHDKMKHQSTLMHNIAPSLSSSAPRYQPSKSSVGLVHQIDSMQQQQQQKEQPALWETESTVGTDSWNNSYQHRHHPQQSWENGSMCGSVSGHDSRLPMYRRRAGSTYSNGGGGGGSVYSGYPGGGGGSVYGHGDDYQNMMTMIPAQQPLVQMDNNRPAEPRSGLIGVISQLEDEKREKEKNRFISPFGIAPFEQQQQQQQQIHDQLLFQQQQQQQQLLYQQQQMMMMNPMMMNPMLMNPMMMNPMMMNPMMMMQQQQQQQQQWAMMKQGNYIYTHHQQPLMEEEDDDVPLARPTTNKKVTDDISSIRRQSVGRF